MDTSAAGIAFDATGVCNYCRDFAARAAQNREANGPNARDALIGDIRAAGAGKPYDCVVGVSGGVDSSWALVQAVRAGLRPLAVHMDNGWNSELAQNNIANLVRILGVDLYTHVIDWNEYRGLMQAFFDADVIDVELLYDNAMLAINYRMAARYRLRHILTGSNQSTEGMNMPRNWNWMKYDRRNIVAISRSMGGPRLRTFPAIGVAGYLWYRIAHRIRWIPFLDYFDFNKDAAVDLLTRQYGFKTYLYKHYESVFTRFYQGYILPRKFGVDKRRLHLSSLVVTGQMSREVAAELLCTEPYSSAQVLEEDKTYFCKKMGWRVADLDVYLARPALRHDAFSTERPLWELLLQLNALRPR